MLNYFEKIKKLKTKLLIQFGVLLMLSAIFMGTTVFSFIKLRNVIEANENMSNLKQNILQLRMAEKDFLLRELFNEKFFIEKKSANSDRFFKIFEDTKEDIARLKSTSLYANPVFTEEVNSLEKNINNYNSGFQQVFELYLKRGFKDWGMEGALRSAIHEIEDNISKEDKVLMLTLRRHEKDFFLRKDLNYIKKFDTVVKKFQEQLISQGYDEALLGRLENYSTNLKKVADLETQIGFTEEAGLKGTLKSNITEVFNSINILEKEIQAKVEKTKSNIFYLITGIFLLQIGIGLYASSMFSTSITSSIQTIKERIETLASGKFPKKINTTSWDEIGVASLSLNNLIDRIYAAVDFSTKIGKGELNSSYDEKFKDDVLATSLQTMHTKLKEAAAANERRNWITTGTAEFGEILRKNNDELESVAKYLLSSLVKYIGLNQGQLYLVETDENEEEYLHLIATYAWNRHKFISNKIRKGDGLVGQAWQEKETIFLTDVPDNYIKITSGIGESNPNCITIIPLKINDEILGVLEVAGFKRLEKFELEFLEKLAEIIASSFSSAKINTRTRRLLDDYQRQTESLKEQEEELRQNQEEMHATQEEMTRQRKELEQRIMYLEEKLVEQA